MPVIRTEDAVVHELPDARFTSYAHPSRGSSELCAWRVEFTPGSTGLPHRISQEEVFLILDGTVQASVDGETSALTSGDVLVAPAGARLRIDNVGEGAATAWVTTRVGLRAELDDGSWISPPWVAPAGS
jgi:quercetin dioxygenase-like cupin family protein